MNRLVNFIIGFVVLLFLVCVSGLVSASELLPAPFVKLEISMFYSWFLDNWVPVSLILSEAAALFGGKWSGIIKAAINIGSLIFKKKK